jgi:hypothetical protein
MTITGAFCLGFIIGCAYITVSILFGLFMGKALRASHIPGVDDDD